MENYSMQKNITPAVLSIAGSDSGGGAGIQADLKVFHALGCFGTTAITCLTAQNPDEVRAVEAVSPDMVAEQVRTVCDSFPVVAAKTGMLYSREIIRSVASVIRECGIETLVVDPVMVSTSRARLLEKAATDALVAELFPLATVITPNLPEAEVLLSRKIGSLDDLQKAARELAVGYGVAVVLKGGHLDEHSDADGGEVVDVLAYGGDVEAFRVQRVAVRENHGTGCTFAAALTAYLAKGGSLRDAVEAAQRYVATALKRYVSVGVHTPLGMGII